MSRPLRIEFSGALYHITARGNERRAIFRGDEDNAQFLDTLAKTCERFQWLCHAYCLMGNHYHLLLETQAPNLSKGMRHLNGEYSRWFNSIHRRVGHLFQGRFKSILVEKEAYLSGHYTLEEIGIYFGRGRSTVSRKVKEYESCGK